MRDLWQPLFRPQADEKHLVRASYVATIAIVVAGILIGLYASSIRQVWDWIMMALGAAFVIPNVFRWYWWRFNGTGYAAGTLVGLAGAMPLLFMSLKGIEPPIYFTFPALCGISLVASLLGTYLSRPTDETTLINFYRNVRPFGWWGPIRSRAGLTAEELRSPGESAFVCGTQCGASVCGHLWGLCRAHVFSRTLARTALFVGLPCRLPQ